MNRPITERLAWLADDTPLSPITTPVADITDAEQFPLIAECLRWNAEQRGEKFDG